MCRVTRPSPSRYSSPTQAAASTRPPFNLNNVRIRRTSDNQFINANLNLDAGGAAITVQPTALLSAFTQYTISVTSGLKDTHGNAFVPFSASFTTGAQVPAQDMDIVFSKTNQSATANRPYASLAWGPDNKLYTGTLDGKIVRYTVDATTGTLSAPEVLNTVNNNNGQTRMIIGMEFDPAATAGNPILWVSHSSQTDLDLPEAPDWDGKISKLSGSGLGTYQDVIVNLPRSVRDHLTDQIHFGPDGALYWSQPSMNAMGAPDTAWVRSDHPLSGAILRLDISKLGSLPLDVRPATAAGRTTPTRPTRRSPSTRLACATRTTSSSTATVTCTRRPTARRRAATHLRGPAAHRPP
jgi:glucose/arabinose dehydrogenase